MEPHRHDAGEQVGTEREDQTAIATAIPQRFQSDRAGEGIEATASVLFGHRQPLNTDSSALAPQVPRKGLVAVAIGDALVQLTLRELDDVVAQKLLFLG